MALRTDATFCLVLLTVALRPAPAAAAPETPEAQEFRNLARGGAFKALPALLTDDDALRAYAAAVARLNRSPAARRQEWESFDALVDGPMREVARRLPPQEWPYLNNVEWHRKNVQGIGNGPVGNALQNYGNLVTAQDRQIHVKCFERAERLISDVHGAEAAYHPPKPHTMSPWDDEVITAKQKSWFQHSAACFTYRGGGAPVEFVADAWKDLMLPAEEWWRRIDPEFHDRMARGGAARDGWCGAVYRSVTNDEDKRAEESASRAKAAQEKARARMGAILPGS